MKDNSNNQIKLGAVISYVALAISIVTGLLYTPWMKDRIGMENFGLYTLATSLISIFMLDFGLGSAVSRFVSKYRAEGDVEGANNLVGIIYKLYIAIDIVILFVLCGLYFFIEEIYVKLTPAEIEQFKVLYLLVAGFNVISFPFSPLNGVLNAYEKFIQLKVCDLISKLLTVTFVVIALSTSRSVVLVVGANILSNFLTIVVKLVITKKTVPMKVNFKASGKNLYKTLFSFTAWTTIISIMQRFTHSFAPSVLGMAVEDASIEIAIYSPAVTLEGYFYLFAMAINGLFLPKVSKLIADKKEDGILDLMIKVGRYQTIVLGLVFIGFVCVGHEFMVLWMGEEFSKTYLCALIILFPTLVSATMQIANTTVIAKNLIKYHAICMIITGVVGLAISFVLSIYIGAIGVCVGTAVTALANTAYNNYIYKTKANINMFTFYKKCYLKAIPCYALVVGVSLFILPYISINGWIGLIVKAGIVTIIYAVVFLFLYMNKEEKRTIIKFIKK